MQLPVIVEPLADRPGYQARLGDPFNISGEALTVEDAVRQLEDSLQRRRLTGLEVRSVTIRDPGSLVAKGGWLAEDELTREWLDCVEEYRQECDRSDRERILGETVGKAEGE